MFFESAKKRSYRQRCKIRFASAKFAVIHHNVRFIRRFRYIFTCTIKCGETIRRWKYTYYIFSKNKLISAYMNQIHCCIRTLCKAVPYLRNISIRAPTSTLYMYNYTTKNDFWKGVTKHVFEKINPQKPFYGSTRGKTSAVLFRFRLSVSLFAAIKLFLIIISCKINAVFAFWKTSSDWLWNDFIV